MIANLLLFVAYSAVVYWFADWVASERCEREWDERTRLAESARRHADLFDQDAA